MLSMFLLLLLFCSLFYLVIILIYLLISVALMNSHNRFVNNPPYTITPPDLRGENGWQSSFLFLLLWTIFRGGTNTNNQSQLTGKVGCHGTSLLAQLHQEWLKLWGLLTLRSPESNLWRDLLQWPTQLLYHYHLTSLWTVWTVFNCLCVRLKDQKH